MMGGLKRARGFL